MAEETYMKIIFAPSFLKDQDKLPSNVYQQFTERRNVFIENPSHPILNNHALHGQYQGCRSINVTGSYRAIFYIKGDLYVFIRIGTHPRLYG